MHERVVRLRPVQEGRLMPQQQLVDALTRGLPRAVEQVLDQQKAPDTDRLYISLASDRLRSVSNAFHLTETTLVGVAREPSSRRVACLWPVKMLTLVNSGSIPGDACIVDNKPPKLSPGKWDSVPVLGDQTN